MSTTKRAAKETTANAKRPARTPRAAKRTAKEPESRYPVMQHAFSLIALSPYRFPVDVERLAVHTARVGGLAFVFLGLVVTYNYIERTASDLIVNAAQTASVATATCVPNCDELLLLTPDVTFAYEDMVEDVVHVVMNVPKADAVTVYAYEKATGEYHRLGDATKQTNSSWVYSWNTDEMSAGEYWLKAVVTNRHGTYDRSDSRFVQIQ